jgi:hypothetical protein
MPDLPRIYFDANEQDDSGAYLLSISGAQDDIKRLGDSLHPRMRVLLYMANELEVEATLEYDSVYKRWLGRADWSTLRHLQ